MAESSHRIDPDKPVIEEPEKTEGQQIVEAWEKFNLLTLDGGGIRGLWTLLVLKLLMALIAEEEESLSTDEHEHHSFYPQNFPANVSHLDMNEGESTRLYHIQSHEEYKAWDREKRYLPCHYFDYIGGTSTGGLIAIMHGRLRMTVPDCIEEYKTFAAQIFGRPRHLAALNTYGIGSRSKYDGDKLKEIFKDVTYRRGEDSIQVEPLRFASTPKTCRCFVTSLRANTTVKGDPTASTVQLIRSYDCFESEEFSGKSTLGSKRQSRGSQAIAGGKSREKLRGHPLVTMGPADNFEIWEVARAATAAPFYFDPIAIETRHQASSTIRIYEDGGMGQTTNPTREGITDIENQHGKDAVGIVVSVGTARGKLKVKRHVLIGKTRETIMQGIWSQSDPGQVHKDIKRKVKHYPNLEYWRLNPSSKDAKSVGQLLNMPLDECEPKRTRKNGERPGARTIKEIESAFANWAQQTKVQKKLEECAKRLVAQRRLRIRDEAKWERFSMAVDDRCRHSKCPKLSSKFTNLPEFKQHLRSEHGIRSEQELEDLKKISWDPWKYPRPPRKR